MYIWKSGFWTYGYKGRRETKHSWLWKRYDNDLANRVDEDSTKTERALKINGSKTQFMANLETWS